MFDKLKSIFIIPELRKRILFTLGVLIVARLGAHIPIPGINGEALSAAFQGYQNTLLGLYNLFAGGAFEKATLFALGIMPYISASIIIQLMSTVVPYFQRLQKEGEAGRKKITQVTRYLTVLISAMQAYGIVAVFLPSMSSGGQSVVINPGFLFIFTGTICLITGTILLMWLGERITERGIGNGISIIIATSILTGIPGAIGQALEQARQGDLNILLLLGIGVLAMLVIAIVVFIERGQRRITVNYAQRQQGRKLMQAQASHLPFKVNMAGVIPAIFASTFLLFPASLSTWFGQAESFGFLQTISLALNPGQPLYILTFSALIISFCFIWLALTFDTKEVTDNLKKSGAFVPGIRPGEQTAAYVDSVLARLTVFGSIYLTLICLLPLALINFAGVSFYLGGTSVLIIVVVLMDFMSQVQSHMMSNQYSSLLKKANLKNYNR